MFVVWANEKKMDIFKQLTRVYWTKQKKVFVSHDRILPTEILSRIFPLFPRSFFFA